MANELLGKRVTFYGDSITQGFNASPLADGFPRIFSVLAGCEPGYRNFGVSGMMLQNTGCAGVNNVFDKTNPVSGVGIYNDGGTDAFVFFCFGVNDYLFNAANNSSNASNFKATYDDLITYCKTVKGWPSNKIVIMSPFWTTDDGFMNPDGSPCQVIATVDETRRAAFVNAAKQAAIDGGTRYVDFYNYGKDEPTWLADGVHPTTAAHTLYGEFLYSQMLSATQYQVLRDVPTVVIPEVASTFAAAGITTNNTRVIREVSGGTIKEYIPGGSGNTLTSFEAGKAYYIIAKEYIDLAPVLSL